MEHVGIDLGKSQSQVCTLTEDGELRQQRIRTNRDRLVAISGKRPPSRILVEASTGSEWVARLLESLGHEVVVADPNYAPMYDARTRRVETDRRDAEALAIACRAGTFRRSHRLSDTQRLVRAELAVRTTLAETRTRCINVAKAQLWAHGLKVPGGSSATFGQRVRGMDVPAEVRSVLDGLLEFLNELNRRIHAADTALKTLSRQSSPVRQLSTTPGVGPVTASTYLAVLDTFERFSGARQVAAHVGLAPREWSSSESRRRGPITKAGNRRLRSVLLECAWCVLRSRRPETERLRAWALRIAGRRGKSKAAVALARKLSRILYAMWRDGQDFDPERSSRAMPASSLA